MAELEKVIKGLECCTKLGCHHGCEYKSNGYSGMTCRQELERDALELLKEQKEKEQPRQVVWDERVQEHECPKCGAIVWREDRFCSKCGQELKWA